MGGTEGFYQDFSPRADKLCLSPTLHINSSAREVSWTTPKADSTWQAETQAAVSSALPQGAVTVPCCCRRLPTEGKDAHKPSCTNPMRGTAVLCLLQNKTCPWGPCEKPGPGQGAQGVLPQSSPSFLPRGLKLSAHSWSYRLSNICLAMPRAARADVGLQEKQHFKCYLPWLSVAKKLWTGSLAPSPCSSLPVSWCLHCCSAPLQEHRAPRHRLQQPLSSCQQRLLTPASWGDSPHEGK